MAKDSDDINISSKQKFSAAKRIFATACQQRPWAVVAFFAGAVMEIASFLVTIYATAQIGALLAGYAQGNDTGEIWFWVYVDIAAAAFIGVSFWLMGYAKRLLYFRLVSWSMDVFVNKLCEIDIQNYYDREFRNKLSKAQEGYSWRISLLNESILDLIYAILRFLVIAVVVAQITWWLIPVIALFLVPTLFAEAIVTKIAWFVWQSKGDQKYIIWHLDWLTRQPKQQLEIRSSQVKDYLVNKINKMNRDFYGEQENKYRKANKKLVSSRVLEVGGTAVGTIVLIRQFLAGAISLDKYFFLSGALIRVGGALNTIFGTLTRMQEHLLFADNFFDVIDEKPKITDKVSAQNLDSNKPPKVEIKDLSFSYPGQDAPVFKNLNLTIESGEHLAIVGENGAGKSTLIKLLLRYYLPDSGKILFNGQDIRDISINSLYSQVATLFQDYNTYPFSIAENIYMSKSDEPKDMEKVKKSAKEAGVDKMVKNFANGYDTVLHSSFEKGVEPSGGQWQRVALARAFYRQANILILDEPTAAIDAKAEYEIFNNIFDHYKNKTAIIVSHRFSTVRRANRIVVVEKGQIVEQGSHKDLMKQKGLYHEMFSKQAEGYKD